MNFGIITDEPINTYHATDAISWSKIKYFEEKWPSMYKAKYIDKSLEPESPKDYFDMGNAVEALLESATKFKNLVSVGPYDDFKKADARAWRDLTRAQGKIPFLENDLNLCSKMYDAVMRNRDAAALIAGARPQITFRTQCNGVTIQCRSDLWSSEGVILPSTGEHTGPYDCDIKTTEDLSPGAFRGFPKAYKDLGYHKGSAWYRFVIMRCLAEVGKISVDEVIPLKRFFIAVDKSERPECVVYTPSEASISLGEKQVWSSFNRLTHCIRENDWPGAPTGVQVVDLPEWEYRADEKKTA